MNDPDYDTLLAAHEALKKKTADWKVKVKELTIKDRSHIQEQKDEIDVLNKQLQNQKEIINDKSQELSALTTKHEDLRKELVDTLSDLQKVTQYKSRITELEDQLLHSEGTIETLRTNSKAEKIKNTHALSETVQERDNEIAAKADEISHLRSKITDHEKRNELLRQERDGTLFLSSTSKTVKRVCHEGNIWLLLEHTDPAQQSKQFRWFEEEMITSVKGNSISSLPPVDEEATSQDHEKLKSLASETSTLREELKRQKGDHERQLALKDQEGTRLLKRIEALQEENSKLILRQNQNDGSKMIQLREELESQIRDELSGQLTDLQYTHEQTLSDVKKVKRDLQELSAEYTQYKHRAQTAISKSRSQQELDFKQQLNNSQLEIESLKESLQQIQQEYDQTHKELSEAVSSDKDKTEEIESLKAALQRSSELCEESKRESNMARQTILKLKKLDSSQSRSPANASSTTEPPPVSLLSVSDCDDGYKEELEAANREIQELKSKLDKTSSALKSVTEEMRARDDNYIRMTPTPPPQLTQASSATNLLSEEEVTTPAVLNGDAPKAESEEEVSEPQEKFAPRQQSNSSLVCSTAFDEPVQEEGELFSVQDLVTAASLHDGSPVSQLRWTERKVARLSAENSALRTELARHRTLPAEISSLRKQVEEANRSIQRQDCSRHIDYLKNIILQFCLARNDFDMQSKMIPLLSSMLELSPDEKKNLDLQYPQS
eukprot:TRINITY_DN5016_c0_g1_i1.p1 TRINITY_DN5016_c0_g1~~TRINITY_DN5016_c0_g1_i1.p1  ORF type:complete len:723 (+),score=186.46 TRINITY_DN5016_c0_g1_i1:102-2270(+)